MNEPIILYVDDERANRIVFEQSFKARFPVRVVASGEEALTVLREHPVSVLVTDQRMPGMSGHELLEQARLLYPETIRIIITAYGDVDPILHAVNNGLVARYLVKPWDRAELEQILAWGTEAHALARRDSALQLRLMETERLVTIGSIGAAVLHDLQQPIASVNINLERLGQHATLIRHVLAKIALPPEHRKEIDIALAEIPELIEDLGLASQVMQGIVQHLRSFLRHGQGQSADAATQAAVGVEPLPIIRYAISVCRDITARMMAQIIYDGPSSLPRVRIGATELTQVLINLIANASHSLVKEREGRVLVTAHPADDGVRFVIADNGAGMPPDVLQRAGTPFFSTRDKGTGLGLSQCHRLLGAVGARLELESTVGVGTVARFTMPILPAS
ncbi:MAG: ATP-binding protein [Polyangia bacterium]